ncbi:MAG: hypothetical protein IT323_01160, partial [Anaerolineae bacterium]|nr:hypothetical protein [Anaerolineae bacterium]
RLIDELRINALVRGVHALRGHATSNGGDIRECWSDMARWLCLLAEPDSYEVSVLKLLVPDIDALVEYPVPVVPDLDAQTSRERLAAVLEALFQRQKTPLLLILEDLQWFRGDALALVARICRAAEHAPLFIVGSYRDDEAPDMPHRLPGMRPLHLDRLSPPHIAEMSELMLGAAGRGSQLIDLLQRETEGNAFFIVEVVRALAEEAGELAQIGRLTLPSSVFAGGMRQVINRRLGRVPESARPLLQIAAVAGRYLDLHLLQAIAGPDFDLQGWLGACADAAVLDVHPGGWRFSHDKLREGLLEALTPAARRARHRTVAEGIERVYPDRVAYVTTLAYHWTQAGDLAKEARYKAQAGKLAVENFAFSEAIPLLARALELAPQVGLDAAEQAALESQLGIAEPVFELSIGHFQRALVLLRQPIPPPRTNWRSAAEFVRQVAVHRSLPSRLIRARRARRARLLQAAQTYQELSGRYWAARKIQPGAFAALRALNLAERAGPSATLARAYAGACIGASGVLALHRLARRYAHLARRVADAADEPGTLAYVLNAVSLPAIFDARWLDARADLMPSVQLGRELHDAAAFLGATANLMTVCYYQGHFAEGLSYAERALGDLGQAVTGATDYANVRLNQARHLIALRRLDEAIAVLGNLSTLVDQGDGGRAALQREALLCLAYCRKGDTARAGDALAAAARLRDHTGASKKLLAEAAVEMWWAAGADSPPTTRALASEAVAALGSVARVRACECPGFYRLLGAAAWLESARGDADEAWRLAIREAQRLEMPYEEAQSIDLLCRHARLSPRERTHFTDRASALKSQLFAAQD